MTRSQFQIAAIVLTVITAAVHLLLGALALGDARMWPLNALWLLNGLGYIYLMMAAYARAYVPFPIPRANAPWVLLGFAALTILAWVAMSGVLRGEPPTPVGIADKIVEVLLIIAIILRERALAASRQAPPSGADPL